MRRAFGEVTMHKLKGRKEGSVEGKTEEEK